MIITRYAIFLLHLIQIFFNDVEGKTQGKSKEVPVKVLEKIMRDVTLGSEYEIKSKLNSVDNDDHDKTSVHGIQLEVLLKRLHNLDQKDRLLDRELENLNRYQKLLEKPSL